MSAFDFTRDEYDYFVNKCMFNYEEKQILEMKIKGETIVSIAMKLNISEATVSRRIRKIRNKILRVIK